MFEIRQLAVEQKDAGYFEPSNAFSISFIAKTDPYTRKELNENMQGQCLLSMGLDGKCIGYIGMGIGVGVGIGTSVHIVGISIEIINQGIFVSWRILEMEDEWKEEGTRQKETEKWEDEEEEDEKPKEDEEAIYTHTYIYIYIYICELIDKMISGRKK